MATWAGWPNELNLTDAQKQQIKTMMQAQRATTRPLMQQLAENRKAMLTATANGAFDQAKVQAIANQQSQAMAQLMVQKASMQHQIYTQVLTAEQRTTGRPDCAKSKWPALTSVCRSSRSRQRKRPSHSNVDSVDVILSVAPAKNFRPASVAGRAGAQSKDLRFCLSS